MESKHAIVALAALAQDTRLAIFRTLVQTGPAGLSVGEIAAEVKSAPATMSFHLKELSHAGLITARQVGRYIFYAADYSQMSALLEFLTENCCARDSLSCAPASCGPAGRKAGKPRKAAVKARA